MSDEPRRAAQWVGELRLAFDQAFAAPVEAELPRFERLLSIFLGREAFALPIQSKFARVSGLLLDRPLVPLPSDTPEFLGLVGVRGEIVPVFDLARSILGVRSGAPPDSQRWLALLRLPAAAGLAFDGIEGLLDVPVADIAEVAAGEKQRLIDRVVRRPAGSLPVIDLDAIAEIIRAGAGQTAVAALRKDS